MGDLSNEGKDSVTSVIKDRLADPLLGTLILVFAFVNYQDFLILIFGEGSIEERVQVFQRGITDLVSIVWPFVITLVYVFLYPYLK